MAFIGKIKELVELAGLDDPEVQRIAENAELFPGSMNSAEKLLLAKCKRKGINLAKPPVFDVPGDLPREGMLFGQVLRGETPVTDYLHPDAESRGNQGVFGITGSGKSSIVSYQCERLISQGISVVILDEADEYGWLVNRFPADKLLVISARNFPLALFENPVGSCLSDLGWLSQVVSVLREAMYLRDGSCNLLLKVGGDLYRERGVLKGSRDYPLASEVFTELTNRKFSAQTRHAGYLETLVNRFHGMLQNFPCFNARRSLAPEQVVQRSLIVRMADLNPLETDLFVNLFLSWFMTERQTKIRSEIELVIVLEEAHLLTSRQKMSRYDLGEPLVVRTIRTCRKFGVSMIVVDQTPSELPAAVLGNLSTRMVLRLTNSPCLRAIKYSMGLDDEQVSELAELPRRRAIVQTAGLPKPFLLRVLEIPERRRPEYAELEKREKESLDLLNYEMSQVDLIDVLLGHKKKEEEKEEKAQRIGGDLHKVLVSSQVNNVG